MMGFFPFAFYSFLSVSRSQSRPHWERNTWIEIDILTSLKNEKTHFGEIEQERRHTETYV